MKNIVIFGGGNGLSTTLRSIKNIKDINIQAIVTVADSGGSTGEIRKYYKSPALGDLRRVLVSLANKEKVLQQLMNYRFQSKDCNDPLNNHSLGNLIMLAINDIYGFYDGIKYLSDVFKINGEVIPLTDDSTCELKATYTDGTVEIKEHYIPKEDKKIETISYYNEDEINVNNRVIEVINSSDLIVFSFGSLYTSIIASMALPSVRKALIQNKNKKFVYLCNLMTQPGETQGMSVLDHIKAIEKILVPNIIDYVVVNNQLPNEQLIDKYKKVSSNLLLVDDAQKQEKYHFLEYDLIDLDQLEVIRHDTKKINKCFKEILKLIDN